MITTTIELWNANTGARSTLHQIAITNVAKAGDVFEQTYIYRASVFREGVRIPQTGPRRGEYPNEKDIIASVSFRHDQRDTDLELMFRALRELRQADPSLFESPEKEVDTKTRKSARTVFS